jgi:dihydrofolate reductase
MADTRKIVAGLFISLDGVTESPDQWQGPYFNDEMGEVVGAQMAAADTLLLGRRTYEEFAGYWPTSDDPFADFLNNTPKLVATNTLDTLEWQNSTPIGGDVAQTVRDLKQQPGRNIAMTGSVTLVQSLIRDGVLDELNLLIHPVVVGKGKRLFETGVANVPLTLLDSRTFKTGVVSLTYGPAPTGDAAAK